MPGNGYPMRLLLPGYQGNMNVKFLRRLKLIDQPAMTYYECATTRRSCRTARPGGSTSCRRSSPSSPSPSFGATMKDAGLLRDFRRRLFRHRPHRQGVGVGGRRQILGRGRVARRRCTSQAFTRFRMPWRWDGEPGGAAKPRLGRVRQRAADCARSSSRCAARPRTGTKRRRLPQPALQQHHQLGHRRQRGGQACLRVGSFAAALLAAHARHSARRRHAEARQADHRGRHHGLGHHACPTAPACRPAAARAAQGAKLYAEKCVACHGEDAKGGTNMRAAGRQPADRPHRGAEDHRQLLGQCHHAVRLHPPLDAVQRRGR